MGENKKFHIKKILPGESKIRYQQGQYSDILIKNGSSIFIMGSQEDAEALFLLLFHPFYHILPNL